MSWKHMLKANKNELLSFALAGFLIINSGFTAPHEVLEDTPAPESAPVEEVPVANNAPTAISVSSNGTLAIADENQKSQFGLIEPDAQTTEAIDDIQLNGTDEVELEPIAEEPLTGDNYVEEVEPISTVEYVEEPTYYDEPQYAAIMSMEATAYLPTDGNGEGITATGIPATYGVAAVDPSVIPLGSRLYVPGYGEAIAADTGGAIYGYRIDLCMESYEEAMAFGRRVITVFVLD